MYCEGTYFIVKPEKEDIVLKKFLPEDCVEINTGVLGAGISRLFACLLTARI
jgi:hypothetical protein